MQVRATNSTVIAGVRSCSVLTPASFSIYNFLFDGSMRRKSNGGSEV